MGSRTKWATGLVGAVVCAAAIGVACGSSDGSSTFGGGPDRPDGSVTPNFDSGVFGEGGGSPDASSLYIQPADSTVDVPPTTTVQLQAFVLGSAAPVTATWSVDAPAIGAIDANGLFTPTGQVGGVVTVFAQRDGRAATTTLTVRVHLRDVPPGFDPTVLDALEKGGAADPNFNWLYPYDRTVFPRGILAPTLQWSGTAPVWIYVKVATKMLDYVGVYAPTNSNNLPGAPPQLDLPARVWSAITLSAGSNDPATVAVTKYTGPAQVTGPVRESWTIAQGSLKGLVYYNSYDSPLAAGDAGAMPGANDMGAVMRIKPGASAPEVLLGGAAKGSCTVCHTVSANGSTIALSAGHTYDAIYALDPDGGAPIGPSTKGPDNAYSFGALTPDGKYLLSCGAKALPAGDGGPLGAGDFTPNVVSMTHEQTSQLFDTSDGGVVVAALPGVPKALMPAFAPDGTKVVFNRFVEGEDQKLSVMPFDASTRTFGAYEDVFVDPDFFLSWPSFFPDSTNFVFQTSSSSGQYASFDPDYTDANGELFMYFAGVKDVHHLRAAMGSMDGAADGVTYLRNPNGAFAPQDLFKHYEPTALPVASGGYFWVVFTSRRSYGNTIDNSDPSAPPDRSPKKLWVTAVDIGAAGNVDPSHPAFYLPGQELAAGNLRGFWALEPCKQNGGSCASGAECCGGFCRQVDADGGPAFVCIPPPSSCANEDEKCTTTADCCGAPANGIRCINGFCARPTPR